MIFGRNLLANIKPKEKNHILVYQTTDTNRKLIPLLQKFSKEHFIVYGFNKNEQHGNIHYKKFSQEGFLKDLSSAKAAIVNGGHNVISESLYFGKPILAIPIKDQFEQCFNGISLKQEGFGTFAQELNEDAIEQFICLVPYYKKRIKTKLSNQDTAKCCANSINKIIHCFPGSPLQTGFMVINMLGIKRIKSR